MDDTTGRPCPPLERPHYFVGRLLSAADLTAEQDYQRARQRRHNLRLHGWGVVDGLEVVAAHEQPWQVVVDAGYAIDAQGEEICVSEPARVDLTGLTGPAYLALRFVQEPVDIQPTADGGAEPARWRDGVELALIAEPADPWVVLAHVVPPSDGTGNPVVSCEARRPLGP